MKPLLPSRRGDDGFGGEATRGTGRRLAGCLFWIVAVLVVALAVGWMGGWIGDWLLFRELPARLPLALGEVRLSLLDRAADGVLPEGATLVVSPGRLREVACRAAWWARFLPRGLLPDSATFTGEWRPDNLALSNGVPVRVVVDPAAGWHPLLHVRIPVESLNRLLREDSRDRIARDGEWLLGKYVFAYRLSFKTIAVASADASLDEPIEGRRLRVEATGRVRFEFDERKVSASAVADVRRLNGVVDVRFRRDGDGIEPSYAIQLNELDLAVDNLPPSGEKLTAEKLRLSLERSLNRRRSRERFSRQRLPAWIPLDVVLDIRFEPAAALATPALASRVPLDNRLSACGL